MGLTPEDDTSTPEPTDDHRVTVPQCTIRFLFTRGWNGRLYLTVAGEWPVMSSVTIDLTPAEATELVGILGEVIAVLPVD